MKVERKGRKACGAASGCVVDCMGHLWLKARDGDLVRLTDGYQLPAGDVECRVVSAKVIVDE